jgi:hypothetical protein
LLSFLTTSEQHIMDTPNEEKIAASIIIANGVACVLALQ